VFAYSRTHPDFDWMRLTAEFDIRPKRPCQAVDLGQSTTIRRKLDRKSPNEIVIFMMGRRIPITTVAEVRPDLQVQILW
jgi:hypothetical protein